jgi:hypothetical protein
MCACAGSGRTHAVHASAIILAWLYQQVQCLGAARVAGVLAIDVRVHGFPVLRARAGRSVQPAVRGCDAHAGKPFCLLQRLVLARTATALSARPLTRARSTAASTSARRGCARQAAGGPRTTRALAVHVYAIALVLNSAAVWQLADQLRETRLLHPFACQSQCSAQCA